MDVLDRIKQLALHRQILLTRKVEEEMLLDNLTPNDLIESIVNAPRIDKTLRSKNPDTGAVERLYVMKGRTFSGCVVYTKGKIINNEVFEVAYYLISGKKAR